VAEQPQLAQLAARKRALLSRSEQLRRDLQAELANLRGPVAWAQNGYALIQATRPYWPVIAGAAGFFVARRRGGWFRAAGKLWSLWRLGKRFAVFGRRFGQQGGQRGERDPTEPW
jgi:hypothetical protein